VGACAPGGQLAVKICRRKAASPLSQPTADPGSRKRRRGPGDLHGTQAELGGKPLHPCMAGVATRSHRSVSPHCLALALHASKNNKRTIGGLCWRGACLLACLQLPGLHCPWLRHVFHRPRDKQPGRVSAHHKRLQSGYLSLGTSEPAALL